MAFQRAVKFGEIIYRHHECTVVKHMLGRATDIRIRSYMQAGSPVFVEHVHALPLDESLTFQGAEAWAQEQEDYAEYEDPAQAALDEVLPILTDEQAEGVIDAFPMWAAGIAYAVGIRVRHKDALYRCVQAHTSQADWTPDATPALWTRIGDPGDEWPEWVQPTGAQDAYAMGDKVSHNDAHWTSDVDANVWEPGVYGWTEVA